MPWDTNSPSSETIALPDRIISINKPYRWTSFDVVRKLRRPLLDEKRNEAIAAGETPPKKFKVGHAGTLDPLATGLLIICTGKFTRSIEEIQSMEKEYTGTITLGATTESFDLETKPENFKPFQHITPEQILSASKNFSGEMLQTPPAHSAKKIEGKRAYEMARKGIDVEMKPALITIKNLKITGIRLPEIDFVVQCSKGTYIRSIASDLGRILGTGAYLSSLCRTRIGTYSVAEALSPEEFIIQLADR